MIMSTFFLQTCNVVPTDEGLEVTTTTQWTQSVQQAVAAICAIKKNRQEQILQVSYMLSV